MVYGSGPKFTRYGTDEQSIGSDREKWTMVDWHLPGFPDRVRIRHRNHSAAGPRPCSLPLWPLDPRRLSGRKITLCEPRLDQLRRRNHRRHLLRFTTTMQPSNLPNGSLEA